MGELVAEVVPIEGMNYAKFEDGLLMLYDLKLWADGPPIQVVRFNGALYKVQPPHLGANALAAKAKLSPESKQLVSEMSRLSSELESRLITLETRLKYLDQEKSLEGERYQKHRESFSTYQEDSSAGSSSSAP